jgi:hypothetical protein
MVLAGCSGAKDGPGCRNIVIDWVDSLQVNGVRFYDLYPNHEAEGLALGPKVGRITSTLNDTVCDLSYQMKDGDATFLAKGTRVYTLAGYDSAKVVSAAGRVYEARPGGGTTGADQLPFAAASVQRVVLLSQIDGKTVMGVIEDSAEVQAFAAAVLRAPVEDETDESWNYLLEFQLGDGLRFQRNFSTETGVLRQGVHLSESARQLVINALQ